MKTHLPNEKVQCFGRNGWFDYAISNVFCAEREGSALEETAWVEICSKRIGRSAPIMMRGPRADLIEIFENIVEDLKQG